MDSAGDQGAAGKGASGNTGDGLPSPVASGQRLRRLRIGRFLPEMAR